MQLKKWANMLEFKAESLNMEDHQVQEATKLLLPEWMRVLMWYSEVI